MYVCIYVILCSLYFVSFCLYVNKLFYIPLQHLYIIEIIRKIFLYLVHLFNFYNNMGRGWWWLERILSVMMMLQYHQVVLCDSRAIILIKYLLTKPRYAIRIVSVDSIIWQSWASLQHLAAFVPIIYFIYYTRTAFGNTYKFYDELR